MKKILFAIAFVAGILLCASCSEAETMYISPSTMNLKVGESQYFSITVTGKMDIKCVQYGLVEGGENYVRIDGTKVTGIAPGTATVKAGYFPEGSTTSTHVATMVVNVTQ